MKIEVEATIKGKKNTFKAFSPLLVIRGRELMMIELCGADTAIRAIWANIVKARSQRDGNGTDVFYYEGGNKINIAVIEKEKYISKSYPNRILIYSKRFAEKGREAFLGGTFEEPPIHFIDAFKMKNQDIPFLTEWSTALWKIGLEVGGVAPLTVFSTNNISAWEIKETRKWKEELKKHILSGDI